MPTHGEYRPGSGWYSEATRTWHEKPGTIGKVTGLNQAAVESKREEFNGWGKRPFKRDGNMDRLIDLRDSDRESDRRNFERAITPGFRMQLHSYEASLKQAATDGTLDGEQ